jgi:predicted phage terminase large subunit-like protein
MTRIPSNFISSLEASIYKDDFYQFIVQSWHVVEQDTFIPNWHIQAMALYMQALYEGRIPSRNLIINVPPGHMKSLIVNVFFPAWVWTKDPSKKFLCYSYSGDLTIRDSMKCRTLIGSMWYQERFPLVIDERNDQKDDFSNLGGGYRKCFGMGGSLGGWRGDFLLIDDPLEMSKSDSKAERDKVNNAYDTAISSRASDPNTCKKVIIMQRLHEEDLCGHVMEKEEQWEQLILPAEYEGERFVSSIGFKDPRTEIGQLLWAERFNEAYTRFQKSNLGTRGTAGQLQQRPAPLTGNIFKKSWFENRYHPRILGYYISGDTASSVSTDAARSSIVVGGITDDYRLVLVSVWADKVEFPQLVSKIIEIASQYKEDMLYDIIIEKKSSGISAIQTIQQNAPEWMANKVVGYTPKVDKEARASLASKWCENGSVILPPIGEEWLLRFETELFDFPNGKYKDMVDSFVQLTLWVELILSDGLHSRMGV